MNAISLQLLFQQATQHHQAGRLREAEQLYRQILLQHPRQPDVLQLLGVIAGQQGNNETALDLIGQSLSINPNNPQAHNNLGNILKAMGRFDEALRAYRQALALNPHFPTAHNNLGIILKDQGHLPEAVASLRQAVALNPNYAEACNNLALALKASGQFDEALAAYRRAIALRPNYSEAHGNLANILNEQGQTEQAIAAYRQAIALRPGDSVVLSNLAKALLESNRLDEAADACRQALALNPDSAEAHRNLGLTLLAQGNFSEGWAEYEWRWRCVDVAALYLQFSKPAWDGSPLQGRTLLLHAEQGLGDSIQFVRFVPLLAQQEGRIILACQKSLIPLLGQIPGVHQVVDYAEPPPPFDTYCPLMSLPKVLGITLETIPAAVPYLAAGEESVAHWRRELEAFPGLKVGIAWQGNPHNSADRKRSIPLMLFESLARVSGVTLISLQKGPGVEQIEKVAGQFHVIDFSDRFDGPGRSFIDSPALMKNLDLVITADTVTCHLAGALGVPVWTLLAFASDWRWLQNRPDTPWYPTMRLFRQSTPKDWSSALRHVAEALAQFRH